jgi:hypothetical protein
MDAWDDRDSLGTADLNATLDRARAAVAHEQRLLLRAIAACDVNLVWANDGCRDMAQWLSGRIGLSSWTARRWVVAAHALERLPGVADAFDAGLLSLEKVIELTRLATPDDEHRLIAWARRVSAAAIRRRADLNATKDIAALHEARRTRYVRTWWFDDGNRFGLEGSWPADHGAVIERALDRIADHVPEVPESCGCVGCDDHRCDQDSIDARRADALYVMASGELSADPDADRATVVVHAPLAALAGGSSGAEIERGPVIHPELARRLACDARIEVVVEDGSGTPVGIGRAARTVPGWLMRQLVRRDRHCTFPGCTLARFVHAHHLTPWALGGRTDLDGLSLVCPFHHSLIHGGGWRVGRGADGVVRWYRPNGTRYDPSCALDSGRDDRGPPRQRAVA